VKREQRDDPPSNWCDWWADLTRLTDEIFYGWPRNEDPADDEPNPHFWHWCDHFGHWIAAGTANHQLPSREPLHLEPSLLWQCCGTHGFVRDGAWIPA
jgi:hypothetical protein